MATRLAGFGSCLTRFLARRNFALLQFILVDQLVNTSRSVALAFVRTGETESNYRFLLDKIVECVRKEAEHLIQLGVCDLDRARWPPELDQELLTPALLRERLELFRSNGFHPTALTMDKSDMLKAASDAVFGAEKTVTVVCEWHAKEAVRRWVRSYPKDHDFDVDGIAAIANKVKAWFADVCRARSLEAFEARREACFRKLDGLAKTTQLRWLVDGIKTYLNGCWFESPMWRESVLDHFLPDFIYRHEVNTDNYAEGELVAPRRRSVSSNVDPLSESSRLQNHRPHTSWQIDGRGPRDDPPVRAVVGPFRLQRHLSHGPTSHKGAR